MKFGVGQFYRSKQQNQECWCKSNHSAVHTVSSKPPENLGAWLWCSCNISPRHGEVGSSILLNHSYRHIQQFSLQMIEDPCVAGSSPARGAIATWPSSLGNSLQNCFRLVQLQQQLPYTRLAQLVEHWSPKPKTEGQHFQRVPTILQDL